MMRSNEETRLLFVRIALKDLEMMGFYVEEVIAPG